MKLALFYLSFALLCLLFILPFKALAKQKIKLPKFIVYYGESLKEEDLVQVDWAIVEPYHIEPNHYPSTIKFFAYLSVGEINSTRTYANEFKKKNIFVQANEFWPNAYWVDIRSEEWRNFLTQKEIPSFINKGFAGIFLDTLDVPLELERQNPEKYKGSTQTLIEFIQNIKKKFPNLLIISNNALPILNQLSSNIDAALVEDLFIEYYLKEKTQSLQEKKIRTNKEKSLDEFVAKSKKPVLNIIYSENPNNKITQYAIKRSVKKGYQWYLTSIGLNSLGVWPGK